MATQDQIVSLVLSEGMDTKTNKMIAMRPELLKNCTLDQEKTPRKRNGHDALPVAVVNSATPISFAHKLEVLDNQLLEWARDGLYSWSPGATAWTKRTTGPTARLDKEKIHRGFGQNRLVNVGSARLGNFEVIVTQEGGTNQAMARDLTTGTMVYLQVGLSGIVRPIAFGTRLGYVQLNSAGEIVFYTLTFGTTVSAATTTLVTGCSVNTFDLVDTGTFLLFASYNSAGTLLQWHKFTTALALDDSTTFGPPVGTFVNSAPLMIVWDSFNSIAWIGFAVLSGGSYFLYSRGLDLTGAAVKANLLLHSLGANIPYNMCAITPDGVTIYFFADRQDSSNSKTVQILVTISTNTVASSADFLLEGGLSSYPWIYNGIPTVWVVRALENLATSDSINWAYFAMNSDKDVVARCMRGRATQNLPGITGILETINRPVVSGNSIYYYLRELDILPIVDRLTQAFYTADLVTLTYEDLMGSKGLKVGNTLYMPGAVPMAYDGQAAYEMGMHHGPHFTTANSGAGNIANGTYQYKAVYEYYNRRGDLVLSLPSASILHIMGGGPNQLTATIRTLKLGKLSGFAVRVALYRTVDGGAVFYRVGDTANNSAVYTVTVVDNLADADLEIRQTWYFPGDVLENEPPDPCDAFFLYKNRLLSVSKDRENYLQMSKEKDFTLEPGHNEFLRIVVEDHNFTSSEKLQIGSTIADKIILFKDSSCFYISGDGPNNSGEQDSFTRPQLIDATVGCVNARSVVGIPEGLMFQSSKGIWIISLAMEAVYIGQSVEDYNALQVTSAVVHELRNLVVFTTKTAQALVYDYFNKQWSVFENYIAQDAVFWLGKLTHGKSTGVVHSENVDYDDDGAFVPQGLITGWLKMKGLQGFQRVKRLLILGEYRSSHQMRVGIATDYQLYEWETHTLTPLAAANYNTVVKPSLAAYYTGTIDGVYQWRLGVTKQKCQAMKITIEDIQSGAAGESYRLSDISLLVGFKPTTFKTQREKMA